MSEKKPTLEEYLAAYDAAAAAARRRAALLVADAAYDADYDAAYDAALADLVRSRARWLAEHPEGA